MHVDFLADPRFDNPRAVQVRLPGFTRDSLVELGAKVRSLWRRGFVEESQPPALPRHIVAQQLLGLLLQEKRLARHDVWAWLGGLAAVPGAGAVLAHLIAERFLVDEGGLVAIGPKAEDEWGRRYFRDLTSSFTSERMLEVVLGRQVLGYLPPLSLAARSPRTGVVVLLGGRAWNVVQVDWRRLRVFVERSEMRGRSRWNSGGRSYGYALARAHHDVVAGADPHAVALSARAKRTLADLRQRHDFVASDDGVDRTYILDDGRGPPEWWTFAGFGANSGLAAALPAAVDQDAAVGELRLRLQPGVGADELRRALDAAATSLRTARADVTDEAVSELKFRPRCRSTWHARRSRNGWPTSRGLPLRVRPSFANIITDKFSRVSHGR